MFIILYAISSVDIGKYEKMMSLMGSVFGKTNVSSITAGHGNAIIKKFDIKDQIGINKELKNQLQDLITSNNLNNSVRLEENERGITIHILDEILFPSATADLSKGSEGVLGKIAAVIRKLPNDIRVEGHTDNVPIASAQFPSNWHLSVARALNTAYYLINKEGLPQDKLSIVGYAEYKPVSPNRDARGRSENRRVDIVILKTNDKTE
ncbi:MAG: flagellar motor protein MotB [Bacteroidota bacterium]